MDTRAEELICKFADGCATPEERQELEAMAAQDPSIADELQEQQEAVNAIRSVGLRELEDGLREQFWSGIYNRFEQRVGWVLITVGLVMVTAYGIYEILTNPSIQTWYRLGLAGVIIGFGLLISGILRSRLKLRRYDRYKEVIR